MPSRQYEKKLKLYKELSKKADAQLRALERAFQIAENRPLFEEQLARDTEARKTGSKKGRLTKKQRSMINRRLTEAHRYAHLHEYAYATAQDDIKRLYGGGNRFDRQPYITVKGEKKYISIKELNKRIKAIESFLSKPSAYIRKAPGHSSYNDALIRSAAALSDKLSKMLGRPVSLTPEEVKEFMEISKQIGLLNQTGKYLAYEVVATYQDNEAIQDAIKKAKEKVKNYSDINAKATVIRKDLQGVGVAPDMSATLSNLVAHDVDLEAFKTITL